MYFYVMLLRGNFDGAHWQRGALKKAANNLQKREHYTVQSKHSSDYGEQLLKLLFSLFEAVAHQFVAHFKISTHINGKASSY
jgi:hypothetical protein